ncbi:MAG: DUF3696 domain-containing protein [Lachnospiraceae bacterium]|nr:DUF3696 domain-containing protein [Lachnospiraceae bacterium]
MIKKVSLKNFKCFENMDLEFERLNLFAGVNGMGKSTLIQAILLLRQTFEKNQLQKGENVILNGHYINLGTIHDISYWYKTEDSIQILIEESNNQVWQCDLDIEKHKLIVTSEKKSGVNSSFAGEGFEYISAERLGPKRYYDNMDREELHNHQVGIRGENALACLFEIGSDLKVHSCMKHPSEKSERLDMQADAWISEISPGIKIKAIPYRDVNLMGLRYSVNTLMGEESTNPLNMGFGVSYVLPVIVSLLKAQEGDLIIVENPEAHLHPKGQRIMGELIALAASHGVQIIIETHSDHVLNGVRLAVKEGKIKPEHTQINFFYEWKDEKDEISPPRHEKTSPRIFSDGSLSNWPEGFFDEWDKAIDELF